MGRGRSQAALAGWVAVASLGACDPSPHYETPEAPLVGLVQNEVSLTASGSGQAIDLFYEPYLGEYRFRLAIPAGAYPAGTRVTLRLVAHLPQQADTDYALASFVYSAGYRFQALQLLPAARDPAVPLQLELLRSLNSWTRPWEFEVLFAREADARFAVVETLAASADDPPALSFAIDRSGLWTLGQLPLPPTSQGRWQRVGLSCGGVPVAAPPAQSLDFVRNAYRLTTAIDAGCDELETGTISAAYGYQGTCIEFFPDGKAWSSKTGCYTAGASGTGATWDWTIRAESVAGCAPYVDVGEQYTLTGPVPDGGVAPATDAGCTPSQDGGVDGS